MLRRRGEFHGWFDRIGNARLYCVQIHRPHARCTRSNLIRTFTRRPASEFKEIDYPKPDGVISFDILTNLARGGVNHEGDQPAHLRVKEELADTASSVSMPVYAGPEARFCPAGVYEVYARPSSFSSFPGS